MVLQKLDIESLKFQLGELIEKKLTSFKDSGKSMSMRVGVHLQLYENPGDAIAYLDDRVEVLCVLDCSFKNECKKCGGEVVLDAVIERCDRTGGYFETSLQNGNHFELSEPPVLGVGVYKKCKKCGHKQCINNL